MSLDSLIICFVPNLGKELKGVNESAFIMDGSIQKVVDG